MMKHHIRACTKYAVFTMATTTTHQVVSKYHIKHIKIISLCPNEFYVLNNLQKW